jgi:2-methylcitrate dehydratase
MLFRAFRSVSRQNRLQTASQRIAVPFRASVPVLGLVRSPHRTLFASAARAMSAVHIAESTVRPDPDKVLQDIADYVHDYKITSELAFDTARLCLIDTMGCGLEGLRFPECTKLLGPVVEGTIVPNGQNSSYLPHQT